jgi:ProFAR isomerase associated superfamily protein
LNIYLYDGLIIARKANNFMTTHQLKLATEPFNAIISGNKTIESRLYDTKRQKIQIGDRIIFTNRDNSEQTITTEVVGLLRYATFRDLFSHNNPRKFGGDNVEWLENQISEFYSIEDQKIYGVIGIELKVCR